MRITGMSSGLDIDSMIRDLMKAERIPVDKLLQKKQSLQWKVEGYNSINLKLSSLRESVSTSRFSGSWNKTDASGNTVPLSDDETIAKVKDIVSKYNDMVTTLNGKVTESVNRGFAPLTSDEKNDMSESDITNWENKAKSGLLRNDDILKKALTNLRGIASEKVDGVDTKYDTLHEIGISTPTFLKGSADNGKLFIDETKLRAALQDNRDAVIGNFTAQGASNESKGVFQKVFEIADAAILSISRKVNGGVSAAESINMQIGKIDTKVEDKNNALFKKEDRYYQIFSNMEKAIANGNAQMAWLSSQFG